MVVMIVDFVLVVDGTFCTIPTIGIFGVGVFCSHQNLIAVKLLTVPKKNSSWVTLLKRNDPLAHMQQVYFVRSTVS
jgi:hypothetical protein